MFEVLIIDCRSDNGDVAEYGEDNREESEEEEEGFELGDDIDEDDEDGDEDEDLIIDESGGDTAAAAMDDASNGANADLASVKSLISSASKPLNFFSGESQEEKTGTNMYFINLYDCKYQFSYLINTMLL